MMALLPLLASCGHRDSVPLEAKATAECDGFVAAVAAGPLQKALGVEDICVVDANGDKVISQMTADGTLLFQAVMLDSEPEQFKAVPGVPDSIGGGNVYGRIYPERADDVAWENERVGFRIYGPATQQKGERVYGYDIFFKHFNFDNVLPVLYRDETDPAVWARVDSLRAIDPALAQEYIDSFSYHIDHGLGMDCYAVGPTLGAGAAAPVIGDSICFAWCYDKATILDNGPLRFTVQLDFAPRAIGADSAVVEHRIISLDSGARLNKQLTWFDGLTQPVKMVAGMPVRDGGQVRISDSYLAVSDPTQGSDNGQALLGVIMPGAHAALDNLQGHAVLAKEIAPADTLVHYWGFAWDREEFGNIDAWMHYLGAKNENPGTQVSVKVK